MKSDPFGIKTPKKKRTALGKGLDALFDLGLDGDDIDDKKDLFECPVEKIRPNPYQPRRDFSEDEMAELAESVRARGILQPILVRVADGGYELIAGERRLRAAKMAGLTTVPVVSRVVPDTELLELSIIENIQRENLNAMEEAEAYGRLMTEFGLTQEKVAERVGKSRSAVANFLRLNQLPEEIKAGLRNGLVSMGHARALLGAASGPIQRSAWQMVISRGLSVRETEKLVQRLNALKDAPLKPAQPDEIHFTSIADDLGRHFGTRVQIRRNGKKGKVEIEFYSNDDLDRLLALLKG